MIHPKMVWLLELPWLFALFGLYDYTFLANFVIQGFISIAILSSFKKHLESKGHSVGPIPYIGALSVTLVQAGSFLISTLVLLAPMLWPGEAKPRWISDLVSPLGWSLVLFAMYPVFLFTMYRLKERVLALDRAERKDRSAKEIRSDLSKSLKKAKEAATAKPDKPEPALTVVLHINTDGATATVWLLPALPAGSETSDFAAVPGAEKVLGPAPKTQADEAHRALTAALTRANVPHEAFVA